MASGIPVVRGALNLQVALPDEPTFMSACRALLDGDVLKVAIPHPFTLGESIRTLVSHPSLRSPLVLTTMVRSGIPEGDSYIISLGLSEEHAADRDALHRLLHGGAPRVFHLLLVEDNPHILQLYGHALRRTFFSEEAQVQVHATDNGLDALERLQHSPKIDLVISDLHMPVMDGFSLIEKIRTEPSLRTTPVLVISAGDEGDLGRAQALGVQGRLSKPVQLQDIVAQVRAILGYAAL